ncbi:hypothetical protein ACFT2C_04490 [Promicromonospora sp. NPDC057138]|uniref:hypothetical protein n=1 Tax=Promicromonospora sp. NPDC057138 TaxID=3346031 RepID=UPI0036423C83
MLQVMGTLLIPVLVAVTPLLWRAVEGLTPRPRLARRIEWMQRVLAELPDGSTKQDLAAEIDHAVSAYLDLTTSRLRTMKTGPSAGLPRELVLRRKRRNRAILARNVALVGFAVALVGMIILLILAAMEPPLRTLSIVELTERAENARHPAVELRARQELYERCHANLAPECVPFRSPSPSPTASREG